MNNELANKLLFQHFSVQRGMFFNNCKFSYYGDFYYSDYIADNSWNYFVPKSAYLLMDNFEVIKKTLNEIKHDTCIYVPSFIKEAPIVKDFLIKNGYDTILSESWLVYNNKKDIMEKYPSKQVTNDEDFSSYKKIFVESYGGQVTPTSPYGSLSANYINCLDESNANKEMFNHYLGYIDSKPVSIATLCMENGYGGLYSAGTLPFYRNRGISTSLLAKCIKEFKLKSGEVLFTQTVKGSIVSTWLQHNGFDESFSADIFVKRSC